MPAALLKFVSRRVAGIIIIGYLIVQTPATSPAGEAAKFLALGILGAGAAFALRPEKSS